MCDHGRRLVTDRRYRGDLPKAPPRCRTNQVEPRLLAASGVEQDTIWIDIEAQIQGAAPRVTFLEQRGHQPVRDSFITLFGANAVEDPIEGALDDARPASLECNLVSDFLGDRPDH